MAVSGCGIVNVIATISSLTSFPTTSCGYQRSLAGSRDAVVFRLDMGGSCGVSSFCFGDGTATACPCGNSGNPGHGCENSSATGGALLTGSGSTSLSADTLVLTSSGERPTAFSIVLQGSLAVGPLIYGDGLRCAGVMLKRLYAKNAVGGTVSAPQGTDPSISARSAALGDHIPTGGSRYYPVYYRDPSPNFCPNPPGNTWNISNALSVVWSQ